MEKHPLERLATKLDQVERTADKGELWLNESEVFDKITEVKQEMNTNCGDFE